MEKYITEIAEAISSYLGIDSSEIFENIQFTPPDKFGDLAFPCFPLAKKLKKSPAQIASDIAEKLQLPESFEEQRAEGPYLNFRIKSQVIVRDIIGLINAQSETYGNSEDYNGKTVVLDFSSPNIAKPFGVGHLRSTVIGNSIKRIFQSQGYRPFGINHLGDWGTQFGKLIYAFKRWGDEKRLEDSPIRELLSVYVKFHEESEKDSSLDDEGRAWFKKLEDGDTEAVELWNRFRKYSEEEFQRIYERLGIKFEYQTGESFYNDKMPAVVEELEEKGLTEVSQDALVVNLEPYNMPPCLIKRKDDATLYITRDLAAAEYRYNNFHFDTMLYVVGVEQQLHFQQLFKVLELMGKDWASDCRHVEFGRIRFEGMDLSTRKGRVIFLEDVLDKARDMVARIIEEKNPELENKELIAEQVGLGAVIFEQFSSRRGKFVTFSWEKALNFEGQTGPYLQYTHARLSSLERKFTKQLPSEVDYNLLTERAEIDICKKLGQYPLAIKSALREYEPFFIAVYLLELASEFNRYYQKTRVLVEDEKLAAARLTLARAVRVTIKNGLYLLGISSPERM
ncbi:MAG: arginine--tRNA ligase [candidate division Zixibacteria bacterium]|nr:arginine--tRNA ligase [candidate division Zixibacteria bacterium]